MHFRRKIMENEDVWGEELPDETIDELFRASQSCSQVNGDQKLRNTAINSGSSNSFNSFRIPNIQVKCSSLVPKNPVNLSLHKKNVFVPKKVSKVCLGQITNNVAENSKAFDNAFQLSKDFHISSDSLKLSQEVHRQKELILQPSYSKHDNFKTFQNNAKFCTSLGAGDIPPGVGDPKLYAANNISAIATDKIVQVNGTKCNVARINNVDSYNSKSRLNSSSLHAELINLRQKSEKVKRNKQEIVVEQIEEGHGESSCVSGVQESCVKEKIQLLPSKLRRLEFAEWKLKGIKPNDNVDLSIHTRQSNSRKISHDLNLLKASFPRGILFGDLLGPCIFEKSLPENPLIELRNVQNFSECKKKKQVHFEKLMADYRRLNNVTMYQNRRTLEHCYTSIHRLILLESLDGTGARPHIEKIVCEVAALLGDQLALLQELKLSSAELQDLDRELAEVPNTGQALGTMLTSPQFWFHKEAGVEARRGLGVLTALASLSRHAIDLVTGTAELSPTVCAALVQKHETPVYIYEEKKSGVREMHTLYKNMKFGFLTLVRDLCIAIKQERRTLAYTGVLTGAVSLLKAIRIGCSEFPEESNLLLCEIVREVVFCRPRLEVIVPLAGLLCVTNPDVQVGRSLCQNCPKDKFVKKCGVVYFHSEDSCVLQVLCCLLESQRTRADVHASLCHQVVRWLSGSSLAHGQGPHWLQPTSDDSRPTCACRRRVAEVTCNLLHRAFEDFVELDRKCIVAGGRQVETTILQKLKKTLQAGILLIHRLEDRNPDFMINVANSEGEWQSFVLGCSRRRSSLTLSPEHLRCLEEQVASVEVDAVTENSQASHEDLDTILEHLWKDNLQYIRRNYVPPRNSNLNLALLPTARL